jgi:PadR family transcriptional regulator, regulatory protein PadR
MNGQVLKGQLDLLLLAAVGTGPAHGYAIVEQLRERSGGTFDLAEGTVYPALHRLEQAGLLRSGWSTAAGRRRRVYELTARGRAALEAQQRDWRQFSSAVSAVLGGTA